MSRIRLIAAQRCGSVKSLVGMVGWRLAMTTCIYPYMSPRLTTFKLFMRLPVWHARDVCVSFSWYSKRVCYRSNPYKAGIFIKATSGFKKYNECDNKINFSEPTNFEVICQVNYYQFSVRMPSSGFVHTHR